MIKVVCILVIVLAQIYENNARIQARIIGGRPMDIGKLPFAALLTNRGKIHCGATVLSDKFLITAAHCIDGYELAPIRAFMGHAAMRSIDEAIIHGSYNDVTYDHDIALLRLSAPVEFGSTIAPVCLPLYKRDPTGKIGTVIGWGDTSEEGSPSSIARHANVSILTRKQCKNMKYEAHTISKNMLCAGAPNRDTCQGDSGGPLLVEHDHKYEIVGITSWGNGCGRRGFPGVYTRVTKYLAWICDQLAEYMDNECLCQREITKKCDQCGESSLIHYDDDEVEESSEENEEEGNSSDEDDVVEMTGITGIQEDEGRKFQSLNFFSMDRIKNVFGYLSSWFV